MHPKYTPEQIARFWQKVDRSGECWVWTGSLDTAGYGHINVRPRLVLAHRMAYELTCGPIGDGLFVLHRCDNRACVNPAHLFLGTNDDNMRDMVEKQRQRPCRGEQNGKAKLTAEVVREIRRRKAAGASRRELAAEFGIAIGHINKVVRGAAWAHIA